MDFISITHSLDDTQDTSTLHSAVVNVPFSDKLRATELGLGIVVLLLVNDNNDTLDRIALSDTEMATGAIEISTKPFHEIRIPLDSEENLLVKAVRTHQYQITEDWADMFIPELSPEEARFNQAGAAIACSVMYPLVSFEDSRSFGAMIFSYFEPMASITEKHHSFMKAYADTVAAKLVSSSADRPSR